MTGSAEALSPGATIGVFGAGQLGRMLIDAAHRLGFAGAVFTGAPAPAPSQEGSPAPLSPAGQVADREFHGAYEDEDAVRRFLAAVDVVTFEFENVPSRMGELALEMGVPVRPDASALHTAQNRARERQFLTGAGFPVAANALVGSLEDLVHHLEVLGTPAIIKTADFGYDGKGQARVNHPEDAASAYAAIGAGSAVVEAVVPFVFEASVVVARGVGGEIADHGLIENRHVNHILDLSVAPGVSPGAPVMAGVDADPMVVAEDASALARAVVEEMGLIGVLGVEMFVLADGSLVVNELAPRVHNSGHLTIEACAASQFEQQIRAVAGLPLGDGTIRRPAAMANLLGDLWEHGEPNWSAALRIPGVALHLYGKHEARPGRKMGHLTAIGAGTNNTAIGAGTNNTAIEAATHTVELARRGLEASGGDTP